MRWILENVKIKMERNIPCEFLCNFLYRSISLCIRACFLYFLGCLPFGLLIRFSTKKKKIKKNKKEVEPCSR